MKRMPNIKLTDEEMELLLEDQIFDYGGEAIIFKSERNTLYKIFMLPGTNSIERMSDNKFRKVLSLYEHPRKYCIHPLSTLSLNGMLIGCEIDYDEDDISLLNATLLREEKIYYLKKAKVALEYFTSEDITYGDVKDDNILINQKSGKVKFCDIDNIRLGVYPIDVMSDELTDFVKIYGKTDESADVYMHNLLTLEQLHFHNFSHRQILQNLLNGNYPKEFPNQTHRIIDSMLKPEQFNGDYIIQYIKK